MRRNFLVLFLTLPLLYAGEQKFWEKQDPSAWTPQQTDQFTTSSPWAKQVTAVLTTNDSNMAEGAPRGTAGGRGGRSSRPTLSAQSEQPSLPKTEAVVRWASAKPMQVVLRPHLPDAFSGHYILSVSGLPIGSEVTEMLSQTTLQVKRGDPVHPEVAFEDPSDTSTVYFAFLPSMVDVSGAKVAVFNMVASPYEIKARFNIGDMKYRGEPAL